MSNWIEASKASEANRDCLPDAKGLLTCDYCEKDITDTGNNHFILSSDLHIIEGDQIRTAIMRNSLIKKTNHFCTVICLNGWIVINDKT